MPFKIDPDTEDLEELKKDLKVFAPKIFPLISRDTLNNAAFTAQKRAKNIVKRRFILRNKWIIGSIRVEKAKGRNISKQAAFTGSVNPGMEDQEFGKTIPKKGRKGVAIPTTVASGEGEGVKPRRKVVRRPNLRSTVKLLKFKNKARSKKQFIVATIKAAAKRGGSRRFVYLPFNRHPGIYAIQGGRKNPKIRQIYDLSRKSIVIPPSPWLLPASKRAARGIPKFFRKSTRFHLKRSGLFQ